MSWATRRKLLYFLGFFIIVAILVAIPVLTAVHTRPSCTDGIQNQNEEGVDCGGPCVNLCKPSEIPPIVKWQQTLPTSAGVYTAVAYIVNPNVKAEAFNVPYIFNFYDASNVKIGERRGFAYLPPGRSTAIVETDIRFSNVVPAKTFFEFTGAVNWTAVRKLPDFTIVSKSQSENSGFPAVVALIKNDSSVSAGKVDVAAILYDSDGNAVAASKTFIDSFPGQSSHEVTFTWPAPFSVPISYIEIIPTVR